MGSQHYSLRWNNHQNHILNAFDTLLQSETLVDVTLVCEETSVRAHKVVLSACSPYFQRIFSENPCKHPIIVLKDLRGWEIQAIVDFMYKGEISVVQDQLQSLIKAAESLQVRGLTQTENFLGEKDACGFQANPFAPSPSLSMYRGPGRPFSAPVDKEPLPLSPFSPSSFEPPLKMPSLPHMAHMTFTENPPHPDQRHRESDKDRGSPIPRRKQARPMRRSGEVQGGPQDLSKNANSSAIDAAENLSLKKPFQSNNSFQTTTNNNHPHNNNNNNFIISNKNNATNNNNNNNNNNSNNNNNNNNNSINNNHNLHNHGNTGNNNECRSQGAVPPSPPQIPPVHSKPENQSEVEPDLQERDAMDVQTVPEDFLLKSESMALLSSHPSDAALDNANFLPMPSLSALSMTPPHIFSLDQQLGLFPGIETCRNPLMTDIQDHRTENHIINKRKKWKNKRVSRRKEEKRNHAISEPSDYPESRQDPESSVGRPKGQHSAPRGGPPRSWTNAELTEALQHVWNKKMTTSQASRIFGIPYNSLLMYVRGKYGKSLKLEQLKKDCLGGPGGALDLLGLGSGPGNNNNHPSGKGGGGGGVGGGSGGDDPSQVQAPRPADHEIPLPPGFNPYAAANFYPDFGPPFPVPVSMIHLLPQSEKNREPFGSAEKARDLFHQSDKARDLFVQGLHLPQDLSSPEAKEDEYRGPKSKSRDNNNGSSVEGSPVNAFKAEPQAHLLENGSEN